MGSLVGDVSSWEFSGDPAYQLVYDHFIGNVNCIHLVLFSLADAKDKQLGQLRFWLNFLRARIPPVEPLSEDKKGQD